MCAKKTRCFLVPTQKSVFDKGIKYVGTYPCSEHVRSNMNDNWNTPIYTIYDITLNWLGYSTLALLGLSPTNKDINYLHQGHRVQYFC